MATKLNQYLSNWTAGQWLMCLLVGWCSSTIIWLCNWTRNSVDDLHPPPKSIAHCLFVEDQVVQLVHMEVLEVGSPPLVIIMSTTKVNVLLQQRHQIWTWHRNWRIVWSSFDPRWHSFSIWFLGLFPHAQVHRETHYGPNLAHSLKDNGCRMEQRQCFCCL